MGRAGGTNRRIAAGALFLALIAAQTLVSASSAWLDGIRVPSGYRVVDRNHLGSGVAHLELVRRSPDLVVNVARLAKSSPYRIQVVLSNGLVAGPSPRTERTSSMCRRVRCLLAVNGDFFTSAGAPVGGLVAQGEPLRSPVAGRYQFNTGPTGAPSISALAMTTSLVAYYPTVPTGLLHRVGSPEPRTTSVDAVNFPSSADKIVAYTPRFGPRTETRKASEIVARIVSPAGPLRAGVDTTVDLIAAGSGNSAIPSDGVVLSGTGKRASPVSALWRDVQTGRASRRATLRVGVSPDAVQSVAGKPVLVRNGGRNTSSRGARYARTMIGWNAAGDLLLVTVDGGQSRSRGMNLAEAADLMRALGAVNALNLDGGGSTTFVMKGAVVNRPSNGSYHERRVAVAVAIVAP